MTSAAIHRVHVGSAERHFRAVGTVVAMVEIAVALVILVAGGGGAGVGLAWLNDRRHAANARRIPEREPKQILEARFAAGEIDEPEFNRRMRALVYGPPLEIDDGS